MGKTFRLASLAAAVVLHRLDALEKIQHTRHAQPVIHERPAFFVRQNAGFPEQAQMPRHCGHFHADQIREFTHATLAPRQFIHDEQTGGMREGLDDAGLTFLTGLGGGGHSCGSHI